MPLTVSRCDWCDHIYNVDWSKPDRWVWGVPLWADDSRRRVPKDLGMVDVDFDLDWLRAYYARRDWRLPIVQAHFWLTKTAYRSFVRQLHRMGLIRKPPQVYFSWRRHFRPLAWALRLGG